MTASGVNPEIHQNSNGGAKISDAPEEEEEEDEDAFHDDLPEITPTQGRYLIQKYATLWFNKIKPGIESSHSNALTVYVLLNP